MVQGNETPEEVAQIIQEGLDQWYQPPSSE
jgi:hypothetical protein